MALNATVLAVNIRIGHPASVRLPNVHKLTGVESAEHFAYMINIHYEYEVREGKPSFKTFIFHAPGRGGRILPGYTFLGIASNVGAIYCQER